MTEIFEEIDRELAASIVAAGDGWADYVRRALWFYPDGLQPGKVKDLVLADAKVRGKRIPRTFGDTVQGRFNEKNVDATGYKGSREDALFSSQNGKWRLLRR